MKIFLTGATGYIGGAVADALKAAGHEVLGLAHSDEGEAKLIAKGVQPYRGNLHQPEALVEVARQTDGTVHTAQVQNFEIGGELDYKFTRLMLDTLAGSSKPFIYTSGTGMLGDTGAGVADEATPLNPLPFTVFRAQAEEKVLVAAGQGVRAIVLRPGLIYGNGGGIIIPTLIKAAQQSGRAYFIGTGENRWGTLHIDDLAELYVKALHSAPAGAILHGTGGIVTMRQLAEAVSQNIGRPGSVGSWTAEDALQNIGFVGSLSGMNQNVTSFKTQKLLDWQPKRVSIVEDIVNGSYKSS